MPQMSPMMWDLFILINIFNLIIMLGFFNFYLFDMNLNNKSNLKKGNLFKILYKW